MVDTPNLGITHIEQSQSQKEQTANQAFDEFDQALADTITTAVDDTNAVTIATLDFQQNMLFDFNNDTPTPTGLITVTVPAIKRGVFVVLNRTTEDMQVEVSGQSEPAVLVPAGETRVLTSGGSNVRPASVSTGDVAAPVERFIYVPVEERVTPTATGGSAALATVATAADQPDVSSLDFNQTTAEHAQLREVFSDADLLGNISFQFLWSHAGATTFGVAWLVKAVSVSNDGTLAVNFEAARKVIDTGGTTDDHYLSARTGFVKILTPADLDLTIFDIFRDPVDGADDLDVDARLQGVLIHYWENNPLDTDWTSVVLMAGFDGEDAATDLDDESDSGHVATYVAQAQIDTAKTKFSKGSLLVDGTGDVVTFPDSADWTLGTGDFTIEGWFRWDVDPAAFQMLMGQFTAAGSQKSFAIFRDQAGGQLELFLSTDGAASLIDISATFAPTLDQFHHIAADFDGTTYRLYADGVVLGTSTTLRTLFSSTSVFSIGGQGDALNPFDGSADEVRVTKGVARYGGAFTPPAAPFPRA